MLTVALLLMALLPAAVLRLCRVSPAVQRIGPTVFCYLAGLLLSWLPTDKAALQTVSFAAAMIAMALLLFGFDLRRLRSLTPMFLRGFGLMALSVALVSGIAGIIAHRLGMADAAPLSGMAAALYTGGTPNLIATGRVLLDIGRSGTVITAANTADLAVGAVYLLFLMTVAPPLFRRLLPFAPPERENAHSPAFNEPSTTRSRRLHLAGALLLAAAVFGIGTLAELSVNGDLSGSLVMVLTVSVLSLGLSFCTPLRQIQGSSAAGEYLILIFAVGMSMSVDLPLFFSSLGPVLAYFACVESGCVAVHLLLCRMFRVDAGTALITNAAGIFGPPFIAPVAASFGNRELVAPGVICGVAGLAGGNLLGIALGTVLSRFLIP